MKRWFVLLSILLCFQVVVPNPPAYALIVNDPMLNKQVALVYAKLTAMWSKMAQIYTTARKQFQSAVEVEQILQKAHQTYLTIKNLDLDEIAESFKKTNILEGVGPFSKLSTIAYAIDDTVANAKGQVDFVIAQGNRIKKLARLSKLKLAAFKNMGKASKDQKQRDSSNTTAENTSTLAALAAIERREKEEADMAAATSEEKEKREASKMGNIYQYIGRAPSKF